jgi:hypothetical protein
MVVAEIHEEGVQEQNCSTINEFSHRRCERDPDTVVTAGCVHEHIGRILVCQHHLKGLVAGLVGCWQCCEVDGHFCASTVVRQEPLYA